MMDAAARLDRDAGPRAPEAGGYEGTRRHVLKVRHGWRELPRQLAWATAVGRCPRQDSTCDTRFRNVILVVQVCPCVCVSAAQRHDHVR
jgi:hypothetical protein